MATLMAIYADGRVSVQDVYTHDSWATFEGGVTTCDTNEQGELVIDMRGKRKAAWVSFGRSMLFPLVEVGPDEKGDTAWAIEKVASAHQITAVCINSVLVWPRKRSAGAEPRQGLSLV